MASASLDGGLPRAFERLVLLKQVARGGMGEVFLAATGGIVGAERPCIVKIIRHEYAEDSSFLARFLDEARVQAQLYHPGIAQVIEATTDATGKPYVVVEYVEGRHLGDVRCRALQLGLVPSWPDAVAMGVSICDALAHMHEQTDASGTPLEIAHRDLSPQNVMVGYGGDIKLIDFGTARAENRRCRTVSGVVFAKPGYIAPEVANNCPGGAPADLYAFGIMLWELLSGQRFLKGDPSEHLADIAAGRRNPTPIAHLVQAPGVLDDIIRRLTMAAPEDRTPSAREATSELLDLLKRAPSLSGGQRSVRERVAQLMRRLYPTEPIRSRREFARLLGEWRAKPTALAAAPAPRPSEPIAPAAVVAVLPAPEPPPPAPSGLAMATPSPLAVPLTNDPSPSHRKPTGAEERERTALARATDSDNVLPGTRYRLLRELGRGSMGIVHEAYHLDLGRSVALKVLPKMSDPNGQRGRQLCQEARVISQLSHDNLVRLHDFGVASDGRPFYAMELLRGQTVEAWLSEQRHIDWREALRLGIQACAALGAAHAAGIVHRDIKPSNLFVTQSGRLKLLDFGIASRAPDPSDPRGFSGVTGTPEYMSPEQAGGGPADERSDLYAVGAVLYEMVTGHMPHQAQSTATLLELKQRCTVVAPSRSAPHLHVPKAVDTVILKALSRHPSERYATAREMGSALSWAALASERRRTRRRAMGFAALTAVMFGLASGTVVAARNPEVRARADASTRPWLEKLDRLSERFEPKPSRLAATSTPIAALAVGDAVKSIEAGPQSAGLELASASEEQGPQEAAPPSAALEETEENPASAEASATNIDPVEQATNLDDDEPAPVTDTSHAATSKTDRQLAPDEALDRAIELGQTDHKIRALSQLRRLGRRYPSDGRVLKAWTAAAVALGGWGEALRVARRWASSEGDPEAHVALARMQRATGRSTESRRTLVRLLKRHPDYEPARTLLDEFGARGKVATARQP